MHATGSDPVSNIDNAEPSITMVDRVNSCIQERERDPRGPVACPAIPIVFLE
jgi:hypothetical protein